MKSLLAIIILTVSLNTVANEKDNEMLLRSTDYTFCVEEVELQHKGSISPKEYNSMILECAYEAEYPVNSEDMLLVK